MNHEYGSEYVRHLEQHREQLYETIDGLRKQLEHLEELYNDQSETVEHLCLGVTKPKSYDELAEENKQLLFSRTHWKKTAYHLLYGGK